MIAECASCKASFQQESPPRKNCPTCRRQWRHNARMQADNKLHHATVALDAIAQRAAEPLIRKLAREALEKID